MENNMSIYWDEILNLLVLFVDGNQIFELLFSENIPHIYNPLIFSIIKSSKVLKCFLSLTLILFVTFSKWKLIQSASGWILYSNWEMSFCGLEREDD